ncbi:nicotinate phosphoribosyltransferase [Leptolyngbya sp. BL0902]|uniref:nicotinate phosphoribosyltransferase n=1 Tax=Leptolyngbya sp. BL0902 TaxID=1115757 RepID=UPI0018E80912|nr:nicotinate phosphoribosyltransferase [Leptolyngbya sp. BL0902]
MASPAALAPPMIVSPPDYGLLTDLYQLTMVACYAGEGLDQRRASFELFARRLPQNYGYLVAMGLAQGLEYLSQLRFSEEQIAALQRTGLFTQAPEAFWELLRAGRFTGDVWAVPEGTVVFAQEPFLRVEAPLWQAQLVETYLLNTLNYQTLVATRAARLREVAGPAARLLEFGTRRAFSPQASLWAARAALAAGLDATSNVLAAAQLGQIPAGTMAHALVMAFSALEQGEEEAFAAFHRYFPGAALLIDTYDPVVAAARLAAQARPGQPPVAAVRLDSGDLAKVSQAVRHHLPQALIMASGDVDEYEITRLRRAGATIDGYGLGTKLVTGEPVNGVYKLVELDGTPVMKEASGKATYPGRKQIFRRYEGTQAVADRLGLMTEAPQPGERPLLQRVMHQGQPVFEVEPLGEIATRTAQSVAALPQAVRSIDQPPAYPVELSPDLQALTDSTRRPMAHPAPSPISSRRP